MACGNVSLPTDGECACEITLELDSCLFLNLIRQKDPRHLNYLSVYNSETDNHFGVQ